VIQSGDQFIAGRSGGVVGAVVPWRGAYAGVAPAHIFHAAGTHNLRVGGQACKVAYIPSDADLKNSQLCLKCRISDTSWSIAYVVLPPGNLPGPGDSGSPLIQDGRVVGLLLSLNMHTCKGIVISAEMIMREIRI
jgi:hypothetical protein